MMQSYKKLFLAAAIGLIGCDQSPPATPPATAPAMPATTPSDPAARHTLRLAHLPLCVRVPDGWRIDILGESGLSSLRGIAGSDEFQILLAGRGKTRPEQLELRLEDMRREQKANPEKVKIARLVERPPLKILERQAIGIAPTSQMIADAGVGDTSPIYNWTLSVYVPSGPTLQSYELNFIGMTRAQFQRHQQLLESIIARIDYDAPSAPAGENP